VVTLYDANGTLLTQVTTDASGGYLFANLSPGTYRVCEQLPAGVTPDMLVSPVAAAPGTVVCPGNGTIGYLVTITAAGEVLTGKDFSNMIAG
jgi:hypothetical protein